MHVKWNPDLLNLQRERKFVPKIGDFEKLGVKFQCSTEEGKRLLVRVIGKFKKSGFHTF